MKYTSVKIMVMALSMGFLATTSSQAAVTNLEGQAGGGIVPWALLSDGTPTVSATWVDTGDYTLSSVAVQGTIMDRVELSYARQTFDTAGVNLGKIDVDVFGAKVKILDMAGSWQPTVAVGVQYKMTDLDDNVLDSWGADDAGADYYIAATKVFTLAGKKMLFDLTLRATEANQIGILGFGSSSDNYTAQVESSFGVFLNDKTILGVEYRMKPDNISGLQEDDWADLFLAYFPNKNLSVVASYAALGDIANEANSSNANHAGSSQRGLYLQIQANF